MNNCELEDVVLTDNGEFMTFEEAKHFHEVVFRKATSKERNEFINERNALEQQFRQQEHEAYYHDLPE